MVNWIGGNGTLWSTGGNWAGGKVPQSYQSADIAQTGASPVLAVIQSGQQEAANPLVLGAAGSTEAVTLINDGSFSNYGGVTLYAGTTLDDAGQMTWSTGGYDAGFVEVGGSFSATGNVTIAPGGSLDIAAGGVASVATTLTVDGTLSVEGTLSVSSGVAGNGTVVVDGGSVNGAKAPALAVGGSTLSFVVSNGGSLRVTAPAVGSSFTLVGTGNTLDIAQYSGTIAAPIVGLNVGDAITVGRSGNGTLTSNGNGTYSAVIGGVTLTSVSLAPGLGGSTVTLTNGTLSAACYLRGTRLATLRGEVPIETLSEGDTLLTADGRAAEIRWIGCRRYDAEQVAASPMLHPVLFRAGSLGPGVPRRDLRVSPLHAMYAEGMLVPAMLLVNGVSIVEEVPRGGIEYLHVELGRHEILLAEGAAAESFRDEDSRGRFDNAGTWHGRGAEGGPRAPKVEHGFALEALRRRIEARAGIGGFEAPAPGVLSGSLDACAFEEDVARIEGWARDEHHPEAPVCLSVLAGGRKLGLVLANRFRPDLARAGFGSGRHGFSARLPARVAGGLGAPIEVRRTADGALLAAARLPRAA